MKNLLEGSLCLPLCDAVTFLTVARQTTVSMLQPHHNPLDTHLRGATQHILCSFVPSCSAAASCPPK